MPILLVTSGYPLSGKTTLTKDMEKYGFERISAEDIREKTFGKTIEEIRPEEEEEVWKKVLEKRDEALKKGVSVCIDSVSPDNKSRLRFLELNKNLEKTTQKALVIIYADRERLLDRGRHRDKRITEALKRIKFVEKLWQKPADFPGVKVLKYKNNSRKEYDLLFGDIVKRLSL